MNRLCRQLHKSFELFEVRKWDKLYVAVDIHETVMEPTWSDKLADSFYPDAVDTLKLMSERKDVSLILWTSSNTENAEKYFQLLKESNVNMDYINCNPEVCDKHYANYAAKFYMNLILDDKAGFIPELDWPALKHYLVLRKCVDDGTLKKELFNDLVKFLV